MVKKLKDSALKLDVVESDLYEDSIMDESLNEFKESLNKDVGALNSIWDCIDHKFVSRFISLIFNCKGNVLLSGIG